MTLNIDFSPQETAWLNAQARQQGLPPAEIVKRLIDAQVAMPAPASAAPASTTPPLDPKRAAAIAYLEARIAEGENATHEEVRQAEEELAEFKRNINANRALTGENPVYP